MAASLHKGISYNKNKDRWIARVTVSGKRIEIGGFKTEEEAVKAYNIFIERNQGSLSNNVLIRQKRNDPKIFEKDENGLFLKICEQCGKTLKLKAKSYSKLCMSCSFKDTYNNGRKGNGYKELNDIESAIKDYDSGISLAEVGDKYGFSADVIQAKMIKYGYKTRTIGESRSLVMKKYYSNIENRKRASARYQGIPIEKWEKFIKTGNEKLWADPKYKKWRKFVIERDKGQCNLCYKYPKEIHVHHIKNKAKYPDLIFDTANGICLCRDCHFCKVNNHEQEYEQFFLDLLKSKGLPLQ